VLVIVGKYAVAKLASSSQLNPDELKRLAETQIAKAMQVEAEPERLRILTVADAPDKSGRDQKALAAIRAAVAQLSERQGAPAPGACLRRDDLAPLVPAKSAALPDEAEV
jgi:hypothetical protein